MKFEKKDKAQYRAMSNEALELRRAEIVAELENPDSEVSTEDLIEERDMLVAEEERRKAAADLKLEQRAAVAAGEGRVIAEGKKPADKQVRTIDRTQEALSSPEYVREFARYMSTRGAELSPEFAQYQMRDAGSAAAQADPTAGVLADAGILVPLTIQQEIIQKLEDRGTIYNEVTKTAHPGGIDIPFGDFAMEASWIGEKETSDYQLINPVDDHISFRYHQLEVRHAQTLLSTVISPDVYTRNYSDAASNAIIDALELGILKGTGTKQMLGVLNDVRLTNTQKLTAADLDVKGYMEKVKNPIARLASGYRNGKLYMAETTWNYYFDGMVDKNGNPVARVNYGIDGEVTRTIFGQKVEVLDEKYMPYLGDAEKDEAFMLYGDLKNYVINSNMQLRADRWEDKDNNTFKSRLLMIVDGKVVNPYGFIKFNADEAVVGA